MDSYPRVFTVLFAFIALTYECEVPKIPEGVVGKCVDSPSHKHCDVFCLRSRTWHIAKCDVLTKVWTGTNHCRDTEIPHDLVALASSLKTRLEHTQGLSNQEASFETGTRGGIYQFVPTTCPVGTPNPSQTCPCEVLNVNTANAQLRNRQECANQIQSMGLDFDIPAAAIPLNVPIADTPFQDVPNLPANAPTVPSTLPNRISNGNLQNFIPNPDGSVTFVVRGPLVSEEELEGLGDAFESTDPLTAQRYPVINIVETRNTNTAPGPVFDNIVRTGPTGTVVQTTPFDCTSAGDNRCGCPQQVQNNCATKNAQCSTIGDTCVCPQGTIGTFDAQEQLITCSPKRCQLPSLQSGATQNVATYGIYSGANCAAGQSISGAITANNGCSFVCATGYVVNPNIIQPANGGGVGSPLFFDCNRGTIRVVNNAVDANAQVYRRNDVTGSPDLQFREFEFNVNNLQRYPFNFCTPASCDLSSFGVSCNGQTTLASGATCTTSSGLSCSVGSNLTPSPNTIQCRLGQLFNTFGNTALSGLLCNAQTGLTCPAIATIITVINTAGTSIGQITLNAATKTSLNIVDNNNGAAGLNCGTANSVCPYACGPREDFPIPINSGLVCNSATGQWQFTTTASSAANIVACREPVCDELSQNPTSIACGTNAQCAGSSNSQTACVCTAEWSRQAVAPTVGPYSGRTEGTKQFECFHMTTPCNPTGAAPTNPCTVRTEGARQITPTCSNLADTNEITTYPGGYTCSCEAGYRYLGYDDMVVDTIENGCWPVPRNTEIFFDCETCGTSRQCLLTSPTTTLRCDVTVRGAGAISTTALAGEIRWVITDANGNQLARSTSLTTWSSSPIRVLEEAEITGNPPDSEFVFGEPQTSYVFYLQPKTDASGDLITGTFGIATQVKVASGSQWQYIPAGGTGATIPQDKIAVQQTNQQQAPVINRFTLNVNGVEFQCGASGADSGRCADGLVTVNLGGNQIRCDCPNTAPALTCSAGQCVAIFRTTQNQGASNNPQFTNNGLVGDISVSPGNQFANTLTTGGDVRLTPTNSSPSNVGVTNLGATGSADGNNDDGERTVVLNGIENFTVDQVVAGDNQDLGLCATCPLNDCQQQQITLQTVTTNTDSQFNLCTQGDTPTQQQQADQNTNVVINNLTVGSRSTANLGIDTRATGPVNVADDGRIESPSDLTITNGLVLGSQASLSSTSGVLTFQSSCTCPSQDCTVVVSGDSILQLDNNLPAGQPYCPTQVGVPAPNGICTPDNQPRPRVQGLGDVGPLTIYDGDLVLNLCQPNDQLAVRGPLRVSQCTRILLTLCNDGAIPNRRLDILNQLVIEDSRGPTFNSGPRLILQNIPSSALTQQLRIPFASFADDEISVDLNFPEVPAGTAQQVAASNEIQNGVWEIVLGPRATVAAVNANNSPVCQATGYSVANNLASGFSLGSYIATDADQGATLTYREAPGETAPFNIVTNVGQNTATITTSAANITPGQYNYDIIVTDGVVDVTCQVVINVNTNTVGTTPAASVPPVAPSTVTPITAPTTPIIVAPSSFIGGIVNTITGDDDGSNDVAWIVPVSIGALLLACCCLGLLLWAFLRGRNDRDYDDEDPRLYGYGGPPKGIMTGAMTDLPTDFGFSGMMPGPTPAISPAMGTLV